MNPETVATVLASFLLGLTLLPLVALAAGRRAARRRRVAEAPHRHPRPALITGAVEEPADPDRAYAAGRRAAQGDYRGVDDVIQTLRESHRLLADVDRAGDVWRVRVAGLSADTLRRGAPGCDYDRGLLAEAFTRVFGSPVEIQEIGCGARGSERCEFAIRPLTRADERSSRFTPGAAGSQPL